MYINCLRGREFCAAARDNDRGAARAINHRSARRENRTTIHGSMIERKSARKYLYIYSYIYVCVSTSIAINNLSDYLCDNYHLSFVRQYVSLNNFAVLKIDFNDANRMI